MSIESTSVAPAPFSSVIRQRTLDDHATAEGSSFVRKLFEGQVTERGYVRYLAQLQAVYAVLEEAAAEMRSDPLAAPFADPALDRSPSIQADLSAFGAERWPDVLVPIEATRQYCDRMREQCFSWPGGFVAHHYTRYLGDLSGGRAIAGAVARTFGLGGNDGRRFYAFDGIPDARAFKHRYRALLDDTPWSDAEQARILEEIGEAYRHNAAVLASLAAD